eukprot:gene8678-6101_t
MNFDFTEKSTLQEYIDAIKQAAKQSEKLSDEQIINELRDSKKRLNDQGTVSFFRIRRVVESLDAQNKKLIEIVVKHYEEYYSEDKLVKLLEKEFLSAKKKYLEEKKKNEKKKLDENKRQQVFLNHQQSTEKIRSSLSSSVPTSVPNVPLKKDSAPIIHPISLRYESRCLMWKMTSTTLSKSVVRKGLVNLGNTCYMNSVIQALNGTRLRRFFLSKDLNASFSQDVPSVRLTNAFLKVIQSLNGASDTSPVSPSILKQCLGDVYQPFQGFTQQDANELLNVLLDGLHNGLNKNKSSSPAVQIDNSKGTDEELAQMFWKNYATKNGSEIVNLFSFQERNAVMCPHCHQIYRSFNVCTGIEVPIPQRSSTCLEDCLAMYCREEFLDEKSLYSCEKCKKKVKASQQLTFYSCPEILVITLKRFGHAGELSKVSIDVAFQQDLNLSPFMSSRMHQTKYRLVAIVNHTGSIGGGHYTADVLGKDGAWSHFSDEVVSQAQNPSFSLAYILFYEKVDVDWDEMRSGTTLLKQCTLSRLLREANPVTYAEELRCPRVAPRSMQCILPPLWATEFPRRISTAFPKLSQRYPSFYLQSFVHSSFCGARNNGEYLERIGDALVHQLAVEWVTFTFETIDNNASSALVGGMTSDATLSSVVRRHWRLEDMILADNSVNLFGTRNEFLSLMRKNAGPLHCLPDAFVASSLKSFVGAVMLNHGYTETKSFCCDFVEENVHVCAARVDEKPIRQTNKQPINNNITLTRKERRGKGEAANPLCLMAESNDAEEEVQLLPLYAYEEVPPRIKTKEEILAEKLELLKKFDFPSPDQPENDSSGKMSYLDACKRIDKSCFFKFPVDSIAAELENLDSETLDLSYAGLGVKGCVALSAALRVNTSVTNLVLIGNHVTPVAAMEIAKATLETRSINTMDLSVNLLGRVEVNSSMGPIIRGGHAIAELLSPVSVLSSLNLSRNELTDGDITCFSEVLADNVMLINLDLSYNNIAALGAAELANVISRNSDLHYINLEYNKFSQQATIGLLMDGLMHNNTVKMFNLSGCMLNNNATVALAKIISENSVEEINVSNNLITDTGAEVLAKGLLNTSSLGKLVLDGNRLSDAGCLALIGSAAGAQMSCGFHHLSLMHCASSKKAVEEGLSKSSDLLTIRICEGPFSFVRPHVQQRSSMIPNEPNSCKEDGIHIIFTRFFFQHLERNNRRMGDNMALIGTLNRLAAFIGSPGLNAENVLELEQMARESALRAHIMSDEEMCQCAELLETIPIATPAARALVMFLGNACLSDTNRGTAVRFGIPSTCVLLLQRHAELDDETLYQLLDLTTTLSSASGDGRRSLRPAIPYIVACLANRKTSIEVLFASSCALSTLALLDAANSELIACRGGLQALVDAFGEALEVKRNTLQSRDAAKDAQAQEKMQLCDDVMKWSRDALLKVVHCPSPAIDECFRLVKFGQYGESIERDQLQWDLKFERKKSMKKASTPGFWVPHLSQQLLRPLFFFSTSGSSACICKSSEGCEKLK